MPLKPLRAMALVVTEPLTTMPMERVHKFYMNPFQKRFVTSERVHLSEQSGAMISKQIFIAAARKVDNSKIRHPASKSWGSGFSLYIILGDVEIDAVHRNYYFNYV